MRCHKAACASTKVSDLAMQYHFFCICYNARFRLLPVEVERDRWLTREEADRLIAASPEHLAALIRFALATGCRAREITGLEWNRVDLNRRTA
ncbi:Phage integrase family protein [Nitrosomonas communis]|uniref:Phage integrase family protein n=1 Tax=Nitrosomonas communis TaxID=44574 RepID=A0A1H2SQ92_9PROT|nr:Phage integrase family protein [Nitrosomonas communis]